MLQKDVNRFFASKCPSFLCSWFVVLLLCQEFPILLRLLLLWLFPINVDLLPFDHWSSSIGIKQCFPNFLIDCAVVLSSPEILQRLTFMGNQAIVANWPWLEDTNRWLFRHPDSTCCLRSLVVNKHLPIFEPFGIYDKPKLTIIFMFCVEFTNTVLLLGSSTLQ
jgi:hypothetical protein